MRTITTLLVIVFLAGCSQREEPKKLIYPDPLPVTGEFQSKLYPITDHEHVVILSIPDRPWPSRCVVYVNDRTNTANMNCDGTSRDTVLPGHGPELER